MNADQLLAADSQFKKMKGKLMTDLGSEVDPDKRKTLHRNFLELEKSDREMRVNGIPPKWFSN